MEAFKRAVDYRPPFTGVPVEPVLNAHAPTRRTSVTQQSIRVVLQNDSSVVAQTNNTSSNSSGSIDCLKQVHDNNNTTPAAKTIQSRPCTSSTSREEAVVYCNYQQRQERQEQVEMSPAISGNNQQQQQHYEVTAKNPVKAAFKLVQQAWGKSMSVQAKDNREQPMIFRFRYLDVIGNGTFGIVCRARDLDSGAVVAIKTVFQDQDHQNRELDIIKRLDHPNIVALHKYFYTRNEYGEEFLSLVLEYLPTSLDKLLKSECASANMTPQAVQRIMLGFLKGVEYLHAQGICHRDIKPHNLLVDLPNDRVKLCDFGCAKRINPNEPNIQYICARYYRAPEITLGWSHYGTPIDIWSVGCVLAEMLRHGKPLFTGKNSIDQWGRIVKVLGAPTAEEFMAMGQEARKRPSSTEPLSRKERVEALGKVVPAANEDALSLLVALFEYDPRKRIKASDVLLHSYILAPAAPLKSAAIMHSADHNILSTLDYSNDRNPKAAM